MPGTANGIVYAQNFDFSGQVVPAPTMLLDGQLLIGSTALNSGGTHCNINTLTAGSGISITNGPGTITITNTAGGGGGGGATSLAGNSGSATQVNGVINVVGSTNLTTTGSGQTLTITPTGNLLSLAGLSGTGYVVQTGANTFVERIFVAGSGITLTNPDGVAGATTITAGATVPTTFTATSGTATPAANNINFLGNATQGVSSSASGSTVTYTVASATTSTLGVASFNTTNFTVVAGAVSSNALTVTAGTGLSTGGSVNLGGSVTLNLTVPVTVPNGGTGQTSLTAHGVLVGEGASAVAITAAGTNGQVLIGATGADPAFATVAGTQGVTLTTGANTLSIGLVNVPNSALANSSITLTAGSGVSIVGSPVSLGGTATISVSGTLATQFSTDSGVATPSANNLNILGTSAQGISTSGAGSTVTLTVATATTAQKGVNTLATNAQAIAGSDTQSSVTSAALGAKLGTQTAHNVLLAEGSTSALGLAAPSATSGVPLISQGASADPIFGTAVVAGGGTGSTSFTAYSVICGGTTSTGALQNVSGVGTTGQILTSNGAGTLPTWQAAASTFNPNSTVNFFDDFLGTTNQTFTLSGTASAIGNISSASGHPGVFTFTPVSSNLTRNISYGGSGAATSSSRIVLGGGALTLNWIIQVATLSTSTNRYTLRFGLGDTVKGDQANGCYFEYSDNENSGSWVIKTANSSVRTSSNTSTAVDTNWHNFMIQVNAAATSVSYFIDGVQVANSPISTNIPTSDIGPFVDMVWSSGTIAANSIMMDLIYLTQTLTSAR